MGAWGCWHCLGTFWWCPAGVVVSSSQGREHKKGLVVGSQRRSAWGGTTGHPWQAAPGLLQGSWHDLWLHCAPQGMHGRERSLGA